MTTVVWTGEGRRRGRLVAMEWEGPSSPKVEKKNKAVVVGGSIAGLSCALALTSLDWEVVVVEKAAAPADGSSSTGAGICLDRQAVDLICGWAMHPTLLGLSSLQFFEDINSAVESNWKMRWKLSSDSQFRFRAAHWYDVYSLLHETLVSRYACTFLWGHQFFSFASPPECSPVSVNLLVLQTAETVNISGNLIIGADGSMSAVRHHFLPDHNLRYSGYCAWRGVVDYFEDDQSKTLLDLRKAYPNIGHSLFFDLAPGTHCVLYELWKLRINWLWYVNQEEPRLEGNSVTVKPSRDVFDNMIKEAQKVWLPELVKLMSETKDPFVNVIYDSDPLPRLFWGNVVLVGDAAHPTTPHGLRSTNMAVLDAGVLAECLKKWGPNRLDSALEEYQRIRHPVVSQQVLYSRRLGRIKQGLVYDENGSVFDPMKAIPNDCEFLLQKTMPFYNDAPVDI